MSELSFFSHDWVNDHLLLISEGYSVVHRFTIGVVIGSEYVAIIDSGLGATPDLRIYIEGLVGTEKPFICLCTHCHPDHVGSAISFDQAYCSHLDWPNRADFALNREQRLEDLEAFCSESTETLAYAQKMILENKYATFRDILDERVFDLGGVVLKAFHIPGHSHGSMIFINESENYAFTGDSINTDVHLKKLDQIGLKKYLIALERFKTRVSPNITLYPTHLPFAMDISVVDNLLAIGFDLLLGKVENDPPGETIFRKRANNPDIRMHYVRNTCIVYNRQMLGLPKVTPTHLLFHSNEKVSEHVYVVTEGYSMVHRFTIGVVVGSHTVLVIDSGLGMDGNLRRYIERIVGTEKPIYCVCTHGAIDHVGSACLFDKAFLNHNDYGMLPSAFDPQRRMRDLGAFSLFNDEVIAYGKSHMLNNENTHFEDASEDRIFDLGGVSVQPISTPGHSKGHHAFFVIQDKILFSGDGINKDIHLKKLDRQGFDSYAKMLERVLTITGKDVSIYAGHLNRRQNAATIEALIENCKQLAALQIDTDPHAETIFQEKVGNPDIRMHYHRNCGIVYNRKLLVEES